MAKAVPIEAPVSAISIQGMRRLTKVRARTVRKHRQVVQCGMFFHGLDNTLSRHDILKESQIAINKGRIF